MWFIKATNVVASQPPERQPTGTPHAHANKSKQPTLLFTQSKADLTWLRYDRNRNIIASIYGRLAGG